MLLGLSAEGAKWQLSGRLRKHLASIDRRFLIVIDDVWEPGDLRPLLVDGPQSRVLMTGRELRVLDQASVQAERVEVPVMTEGECLALVKKWDGSRGRAKAVEFVERAGCLPMAVAIGAGLARDRGWDWLLERTEGRIVPVLQRGRKPGRDDSISVMLALSCGRLERIERKVFGLLGELPPEEAFTIQDVEKLCSATLQIEDQWGVDVGTLLHLLRERSLVQEQKDGRYRIHPLVRDYAAGKW